MLILSFEQTQKVGGGEVFVQCEVTECKKNGDEPISVECLKQIQACIVPIFKL